MLLDKNSHIGGNIGTRAGPTTFLGEMDGPRIYESVIVLNDRLEGLLARFDFLSSEIDNPKSELDFLNQIPVNKKKNILKDQKQFAEHFPLDQRESIKTALKPHMDTLLQIAELPSTLTSLLKKMVDNRIHLDLNLNQTLAMSVLEMVANTTALLIITFSPTMAKALMIPDIYGKLTDQADEELRVKNNDFKQYFKFHVS